jgi:regulator of RNase E activity RraA
MLCHYPDLGPLVGYAVTVEAVTNRAAKAVNEMSYWRFVSSVPGPKVVAVHDEDDPPGGSMWGEWNANVHRALGCVGTVTHGAVRDIDAVTSLGFHFFSTAVSVAHGFGVFTAYGEPVEVAGLAVATGDLLVADRHGVLSIPAELPLGELCAVARGIDELEGEVFRYCQADGFSIDGLADLARAVRARWPKPR